MCFGNEIHNLYCETLDHDYKDWIQVRVASLISIKNQLNVEYIREIIYIHNALRFCLEMWRLCCFSDAPSFSPTNSSFSMSFYVKKKKEKKN